MSMISRVAQRFLLANGARIYWRPFDVHEDPTVKRAAERLWDSVGAGLAKIAPISARLRAMKPEDAHTPNGFQTVRADVSLATGPQVEGVVLHLDFSLDGRTVLFNSKLRVNHPEFAALHGKKATPAKILSILFVDFTQKKAESNAFQDELDAGYARVRANFQTQADDFAKYLAFQIPTLQSNVPAITGSVKSVTASENGFSVVSEFKTATGKPYQIGCDVRNGTLQITRSDGKPGSKFSMDSGDTRSVDNAVQHVLSVARNIAGSESQVSDKVTALIQATRTEKGGRNRKVSFIPGKTPRWDVRPDTPKSLDHYGPDGWDEDAWTEEYAEPIETAVLAELDAAFGRGMFRVDVEENGDFTVYATPAGDRLF